MDRSAIRGEKVKQTLSQLWEQVPDLLAYVSFGTQFEIMGCLWWVLMV